MISVCVVSFNTCTLLQAVLTRLGSELAAGPHEVLIADNASSDGTPAMLAAQFPAARLIANETNLYYTRAMNQCLRAARGEFILLLNPDAEPRPGALDALRTAHARHPDWGAAGARLEFADGTLQRTGNRFPSLGLIVFEALGLNARWPHNRLQRQYTYADWDRASERGVDALSGACLLIRRAALAQVGLLDERFVMYQEEVDWSRRAASMGWRTGYVPAARVIHYSEQSARQLPDERRRALYEASWCVYAERYYGAWAGAIVRAAFAARRVGRAPFAASPARPREGRA